MTTRGEWAWPISFALVVVAFFVLVSAIPQDQKYHLFADARTIAGIPDFWNVVSNLPFAIVGILGLIKFRGLTDRVLFVGVLLTAFGSAYYHLAPGDNRLIWDRLPMTLIFMAFVGSVLSAANAEQRKPEPSPWVLGVLLALGTGSVLWWSATGDLRPYAVVKFGPILYLLPLFFSSKRRKYLWLAIGLFGLAQAFELADGSIYSSFILSGHTLKHLAAGLATAVIYRWRLAAGAVGDRGGVFEPVRDAA